MEQLAVRPFRRILLIKPSSPGDILHALPVARALRAAYPNAHLAWLVASSFADLLEVEPSIDEVIRFDRKRFGRMWRSAAALHAFVDFIRQLRVRRFDLVVDLQGLFRSGFLAWAAGAATRIGFRDAREAAWLFYTHRLPRRPHATHAVDRNLAVIEQLRLPLGEPDPRPVFTLADDEAARALLANAGIGGRDEYVVLVPSTRWETKRWPPQRFGELAARLGCRPPTAASQTASQAIAPPHARGEAPLRAVLVGGRDDVAAADAAARASGGAAVNLCGRTSLRQLAALIAGARMVVTADSTPMHMAAAFGRPLVALFGPTHPCRTGPYRRLGDVLRLGVPCSPCYLRRRSECPYDLRCMNELSVDVVLSEAVKRLRTPPVGHSIP